MYVWVGCSLLLDLLYICMYGWVVVVIIHMYVCVGGLQLLLGPTIHMYVWVGCSCY